MGTVVLSPRDCLNARNSSSASDRLASSKGNRLRKKALQSHQTAVESSGSSSLFLKVHSKPCSQPLLATDANAHNKPSRALKSDSVGQGKGANARANGQSVDFYNKFSELRKPAVDIPKRAQGDPLSKTQVIRRSSSVYLDVYDNKADGSDARIKSVVILQRPKSKEAADKLLVDFCNKNMENCLVQRTSSGGSNDLFCGLSHSSKGGDLAISASERWAGPAFSTSPSPSSLPLPKFLKPQRAVSLDILTVPSQKRKTSTSSSLSSSSSGSPSPCRDCIFSDVNNRDGGIDVALATRNLRKILNLNVGTE